MEVAKLSHCTRAQQGCVLVSCDGERVLAFGYNGQIRGGANTCDGSVPGKCGCVHAEANALVKTRSTEDFVAICTQSPCVSCASLLINAGVNSVAYLDLYRDMEGVNLLRRAGKDVVLLPEEWWKSPRK